MRARRIIPTLCVLTVLAPAAEVGAQELQTCEPSSPAAFALVAPATLPVGYPSGFYLEAAGPGYPDGPSWTGHSYRVRIESVEGSTFSGATSRPKTDGYNRWILRFRRADGPARMVVSYPEHFGSVSCMRELAAVTTPTPIEAPRIRLGRPRTTARFAIDKRYGTSYGKMVTRVRGRARPNLPHPIRLVLYEGGLIRKWKVIRPRGGRIDTRIRWTGPTAMGHGPVRVRALYPGDVVETWPCDDVFSSGVNDGCRERLRDPRRQ